MQGIQARRRYGAALLALIGAAVPAAAGAAEEQARWSPPPPTQGDFDWVRVPSGEWFGGTITAFYDDTLEFDSDHLGDLSIDWEDVVELRSARTLRVRTDDQSTALGRVTIRDGRVQVSGEDSGAFDKAAVLAIAPPVGERISAWSATVGAGANVMSGNTEQTDTNLRVSAQRRTVRQRLVMDFLSNFSETEGETTTDSQRLNVSWDVFATDRMYWTPLFGEYFSDRFRNIDHRVTVAVGAGYQLIDSDRTGLRVAAGPGYQRIWFREVEPGADGTTGSAAFVAETRFDHELTDDIDLLYDYRLQLTSEENGRYSHHMEAGASIDLIGDLDLSVTYAWDRIQEPREDEDGNVPEQDDFQLLLNVNYEF